MVYSCVDLGGAKGGRGDDGLAISFWPAGGGFVPWPPR